MCESLKVGETKPSNRMVRHGTVRHGHNASVRDADSNQDGAVHHWQPDMRPGVGTAVTNPCRSYLCGCFQLRERHECQPQRDRNQFATRDRRRAGRCRLHGSLRRFRTAAEHLLRSTTRHAALWLHLTQRHGWHRQSLCHEDDDKNDGAEESHGGRKQQDSCNLTLREVQTLKISWKMFGGRY